MAVQSAQVSVGTSATLLSVAETEASYDGISVTVSVPTGGTSVYLGPSGVTTGTGFLLNAGQSASFDLGTGEVLYGIVGSGTQTVYVLRSGV